MNISKKDVRSCQDLQVYLSSQLKSDQRLYHYTSYASLVSILKYKSLRLTRIDLLNDKAEVKLSESSGYEQVYIMSFTQEKEYVSMWAMYGALSGIKLRVDFSMVKLINSIDNNFYRDDRRRNKINVLGRDEKHKGYFSKKDFLISPIVYIDKKQNLLRYHENYFKNLTYDESMRFDLKGFLKYDVWEFEREIRLRVRACAGEESCCPEYIFAGINDDLIKDLRITFNPWISEDMKEEIKKSLNHLAGFELEYSDSEHDGEIANL